VAPEVPKDSDSVVGKKQMLAERSAGGHIILPQLSPLMSGGVEVVVDVYEHL